MIPVNFYFKIIALNDRLLWGLSLKNSLKLKANARISISAVFHIQTHRLTQEKEDKTYRRKQSIRVAKSKNLNVKTFKEMFSFQSNFNEG